MRSPVHFKITFSGERNYDQIKL